MEKGGMTATMRRRWSDNDHHLGPFTYARDSRGWRPLAVELSSGDDEHPRDCSLRLSAFGHTLIIALPPIVPPYREKVIALSWDAEAIERMGRNWYYQIDQRRFGFNCSDGYLSFHFGRQTHDSSTDRQKGYFLPWAQWRHVRRSFYGLAGEHIATLPDTGKGYLHDPGRFDRERAIADATPTAAFAFDDFDGERIEAVTKIEEREWRLGTGWFKWLSLFRKAKIRRSLDITFSEETGERKGSWKGGTIGHSIDMLPGELHEAAFRRYCAQHRMTFLGRSPPHTKDTDNT